MIIREEGPIRVRMPRGNQLFGVVEMLLGNSMLRVRCSDNKLRLGRIPGRFRKRLWVRPKDIVLVEPWEIQGDEKGDVVYKYRNAEVQWLKRKNILKMDI